MIINNHFAKSAPVDTIDILNKEFRTQCFETGQPYAEMLGHYKRIASNYARMENAVAVLSDLRANTSYIYYGGFARMLGAELHAAGVEVSSIWEKDIFRLIHTDDLAAKHLRELYFFHFIKRRPKHRRADYFLMSRLRMRDNTGGYIPVLHRMFYISMPHDDTLWLALCLYSPLLFDLPAKCLIVNSTNGQTTELDKHDNAQIISPREKQVLLLIDKGFTSKEIAASLSISINTVSRHRQEILARLQVKNSIEACRVAKDLKLI